MIAQADAVRIPLPDKSVHCAVTSPPYWGLRKYAGEQGKEPLGLEPTPERHIERIVEICREVRRVLRDDGCFFLNYGDSYFGDSPVRTSGAEAFSKTWDKSQTASRGGNRRSAARRAGFQPGSLAMMPHRVAIALAEDGWIVRQDLVWFKRNPMPESVNGWRWQRERTKKGRSDHAKKHNIKGGTEAMLRDASIHKGIGPDWVPEYEYGDDLELKRGSWRHTRAHEYVFQLVKSMGYWSNQEAVREGHETREFYARQDGARAQKFLGAKDGDGKRFAERYNNPAGRNPRSVLDVPTAPYRGAHYATFPPNLIAPLIRATCPRWACPVCGQGWAAVVEQSEKYQSRLRNTERIGIDSKVLGKFLRNRRIELGIKQSEIAKRFPSSSGGLTGCVSNWELGKNVPTSEQWQILKSVLKIDGRFDNDIKTWHSSERIVIQEGEWGTAPEELVAPSAAPALSGSNVLGHRPTCEHPHTQEKAVPGICFDPFVGSGTTVAVAKQLLRRGIGIDISMEYLDQQAKVRAGLGTPSNALENLPLFENLLE